MDSALRDMLLIMVHRLIIGNRHTPEDAIIRSKTKWLSKDEKRGFFREYKQLVNETYILRAKKRTGKGNDWHISLNPSRVSEIKTKLKENSENEKDGQIL
ncbi:MAG: hypothetical protein V1702_03430 [Candidatus Woesearchaeota archaeon]